MALLQVIRKECLPKMVALRFELYKRASSPKTFPGPKSFTFVVPLYTSMEPWATTYICDPTP